MKRIDENWFVVKKEVLDAINSGAPVVALESTIISHGMPYPQNAQTALKVEEIIRGYGVIPATIAILDGIAHIGLTQDEINTLGKLGTSVDKVSRQNLPDVIANKKNGATTVASTMILADLAGIKVFCTGGIGGVHKDGENSMDISADLEELSKTKIAVVCAGAKSILDIGRTLEYLETKGVPVVGYKTFEMPAFFTRCSGFKLMLSSDTPEQIANMLYVKDCLGFGTGAVIANPVPTEFSLEEDFIENVISNALQEAQKQSIKGRDVTPFLLKAINDKSNGKSLQTNIELVFNNARLSAEIAKEYAKIK